MNQWKKIWSNRTTDEIKEQTNNFEMYVQLKKWDGFDIQQKDGYYEGLYKQWEDMWKKIQNTVEVCDSIYEVGCGSGPNLYLFQKEAGISNVGGIDYSEVLVDCAKKVIVSDDLKHGEAIELDERRYDIVLSDSVFQYFPDEEYGWKVLEKMYNKMNKMLVITELHDAVFKEQLLAHRRSLEPDYDEKYRGLDKTFYEKEKFIDFAKAHHCNYEIIFPDNQAYWNNDYVFDFYLWK